MEAGGGAAEGGDEGGVGGLEERQRSRMKKTRCSRLGKAHHRLLIVVEVVTLCVLSGESTTEDELFVDPLRKFSTVKCHPFGDWVWVKVRVRDRLG